MLRTRLWMGALLIALMGLILAEEHLLAPWYPVLFFATIAACLFATRELLAMLDPESRPIPAICYSGVAVILAANWHWPIRSDIGWHLVSILTVVFGLIAFLYEIANFRGPARITERVSQTLLILFYLGVLPSFLLQMRWLSHHATQALALTVFVPKGCDIGAYFTGKFLTGKVLGRTPMTPLLSPKKTWQGAIGGLLAACGVACLLGRTIFSSLVEAIGFGLVIGVAGMLGDLAESLLKRDRQTKDASAAVPGFGGVLDVIDSLLFAAPIAFLWFFFSIEL